MRSPIIIVDIGSKIHTASDQACDQAPVLISRPFSEAPEALRAGSQLDVLGDPSHVLVVSWLQRIL